MVLSMIPEESLQQYLNDSTYYLRLATKRLSRRTKMLLLCRYGELLRRNGFSVRLSFGVFNECMGCGSRLKFEDEIVSNIVCSCGVEMGINHESNGHEITPPPVVKLDNSFEQIIKQFQGRSILPGGVRCMGLIKKYFDETSLERTRENLTTVIKQLGLTDCYNYENSLMTLLWGMEPPNIDHLIKTVLADYRLVQGALMRCHLGDEKKSLLNSHFILRRLLERLGVDCGPYFKTISTAATKAYYNETWETVCTILDWEIPKPI